MNLNPNFVQFCKDSLAFSVVMSVIITLKGIVPPEQTMFKTLLTSFELSLYGGITMKVLTGNARDLVPLLRRSKT